jgi:hypothetical protein
MASDGRTGTKTDKANRAQVGDSLERWYAERGSRVFDGTWQSKPVPWPRLRCSQCRGPAKLTGMSDMLTRRPQAACADHWPRTVS